MSSGGCEALRDGPRRPVERIGFRRMVLAVGLLVTATALATVLSLRTDRPPAGIELAAIGSAISGMSFAGIIAAVRPRGCNRLLSQAGTGREATRWDSDLPCERVRVVGHHVECGRFDSHVLAFGGRRVCAGCTGMALGGVAGIATGLALLGGLFPLRGDSNTAVALLGGTASVAGAAIALGPRAAPPIGRTLANFAFVAGGAVATGVLASAGLAWGVFGLLAMVAAVGLRIDASQSRHKADCADCIAARGTTSGGPAGARRPTG